MGVASQATGALARIRAERQAQRDFTAMMERMRVEGAATTCNRRETFKFCNISLVAMESPVLVAYIMLQNGAASPG
jgi:hypothetical protein